MIFQAAFCRKFFSGLVLLTLSAFPAFAEQPFVACVDISTSSGTFSVLELAVTPVNDSSNKYYSLAGTHKNQAGSVVGSAVGTALLGSDKAIVTVNASSSVNANAMEATLYQFEFDLSTATGPFQRITQQGSSSASPLAIHEFGQAALGDCANLD